MNDIEKQKTRFYKLANGLMSIAYISIFAFILSELFTMIS